MNWKKKLIGSVGPLIAALLILGMILFVPWKGHKIDHQSLVDASSSMSINVIKGNYIKNSAMKESEFVPFFGSSELSRIDSFHPCVMAEKYQRGYHPFLLGAAGTQSLSQFLMLDSMGEEMRGKKAVFIISPQWFTKDGVREASFDVYYSPLQVYTWINHVTDVDQTDQYLARRLMRFKSVRSDTTLKGMLRLIAKGETPSDRQRKLARSKMNLLSREDELFSYFGMNSKKAKIAKSQKALPKVYDPKALDQLAVKQGKKATSNNEFEISNGFYTSRILPMKDSLAGSQKDYDYLKSPEYADFQVFLNRVHDLDMDVQFIIQPVNTRWSDYTGLSQEMLNDFATKIKYQLTSQGFNRILDLNPYASEDYLMADTIHLGWRGWLRADQVIAPFLAEHSAEKPVYQINNDFLSQDWCKTPEIDELTE